MEPRVHTATVTIYNRNQAYREVGELLHQFADFILLRVGFPMAEKNIAIIFLILQMTTDQLGALTGRLGQIATVKVKSTSLSV